MFDLTTEMTWITISFAIFAYIAYRFGKHSVLSGLDGRIEEIRKEISTAESLRVEAQELLAQYQRKQRDAEKEAAQIVKEAEKHAVRIREAAEAELVETMNRREAQLTERLERIEKNAMAEIRNHAAELAAAATMETILKMLDEKTNKKLVDDAIGHIPQHLN